MSTTRDRSDRSNEWLQRMRAWGVRPSRSKGQNFLLDADTVTHIADAARLHEGDRVLEIGPGLGILTEELLDRGADVTAIELDDTIAPRLARHFEQQPRFHLIHDDATRVDPAELYEPDAPYRIVANLPYSVATVIVRHFLESARPPVELIVMVQQEVAERMTATEGDLSLLTLATRIHTEPTYLFTVPAEAFYPPPKVTSAVVRLTVRTDPVLSEAESERLFTLATMAFQQKRKTLLNTLSRGLGMGKDEIGIAFERIGIDGGSRPQALSFEDWVRLATADLGES